MAIVIEKGVSLKTTKFKEALDVFKSMDSGDSFVLPLPPNVQHKTYSGRVYAAFWREFKCQFRTRTDPNGVRVFKK